MNPKIGIVGTGRMGIAHAQAYQKAGACVAEVYDVNRAAAKALSEEHGAHCADSLEAVISSDVDAISICLPHNLHYEAAMLCAKEGKHALVEKPIDISMGSGLEVVEAFSNKGLNLMIGFTTRFYRSQIYLKKLISNGYFGKIRLIVENLAAGGHQLPAWYSAKEIAGGGILMMGISHTVDRIGWLLDDRVESAYSQSHPETLQGNVEDVASSVLVHSRGALLSVAACRSALKDHEREHICKIYGNKAQASMTFGPNHEQTLDILGSKGKEQHTIMDDDPCFTMITEFLCSIAEGRSPSPCGKDGLMSLAVVEAMYKSAATGEVISSAQFIGKEH